MTSYQKIKMKATLYKMSANDNNAPEYRVVPKEPMKQALEAVKRILTVVEEDLT